MTSDPMIQVRRVYEPRDPSDGFRVLVDRLWPRGLSKAAADIDEWCEQIAPSTELRRWYGHEPERYAAFRDRYLRELDDADHSAPLAHLRTLAGRPLTLLTATHDVGVSHAQVLAQLLDRQDTGS